MSRNCPHRDTGRAAMTGRWVASPAAVEEIPPAAITGIPVPATASSTDGSSSVVRRGRCARRPAALHDHRVGAPAGHLLACLAAPTDGMTPRRQRLWRDQIWSGARAKEATLTPARIRRSTRSFRVTGVGADVDAERLVGGGLHLAHGGGRNSSSVIVADAGFPGRRRWRWRPPGGRRPPAHAGLHDQGMLDADQFGQRIPWYAVLRLELISDLFVPQRLQSMTSEQFELGGAGQPGLAGGVQPAT